MPPDVSRVLALEVPVIVVLGERPMRMADVLNLIPGAIIELPKHADDELSLLVNNKPVATGTAVKVGENFGLRITFVGDLKERIKALGEASAAAKKQADAASAEPDADALADALLAGQM